MAVVANDTIPGSELAAIITLVPGRLPIVGSSSDLAHAVDELQWQPGLSPAGDAVRCQRVIRVDATDKDRRWPDYSRAVAAEGIASILSFPLVWHHESIGALNCYSRVAAAFSADDEWVASSFASATAMAMAYWNARSRGDHLSLALQSPAAIEQAIGIITAGPHSEAIVPPRTGWALTTPGPPLRR